MQNLPIYIVKQRIIHHSITGPRLDKTDFLLANTNEIKARSLLFHFLINLKKGIRNEVAAILP